MNCNRHSMRDKIYISGPITGCPDAEKKFLAAEDMLRSLGFDVLNPITIEEPKPEWGVADRWLYFMRRSIKMLCDADIIYLLDGWGESLGSKIERNLATEMGLRLMYEIKGLTKNKEDQNIILRKEGDETYINNALKLGWEIVKYDKALVTLRYKGPEKPCPESNGTTRLDD